MPSGTLNIGSLVSRLTEASRDRAFDWAEAISRKAYEMHESAPRGGNRRNRYGQPRSAPGEPPAPEEGTLLELIKSGVRPTSDGAAAVVNYKILEDGDQDRNIAPRPLGFMVLEEAKAFAASGGNPEEF